MNYPNHAMTTAGMQPGSASISLPPISSIDFRTHQAHHAPPEVLQPMPPQQPPRQLPPLPHQQQQQQQQQHQHQHQHHYYNGGARTIPHQPEYVHQQRAIYPGMQVGSPYQLVSTRIPLPSTTDPNLIVAPPRHKTKEVKRRTKTGCLTCRKRRIKCDEGRPDCRNCQKSKRQCLGYDPVFSNQVPQSIAPSQQSNSSVTTTASQPQHYHTSSPSTHNHASLPSSVSQDFSFSKPPDLLPTLNQPYRMDNAGHAGMHSYPSAGRPSRPRSIEEICTLPGTKIPPIPAIPPDSVPNLDSIRKVYDVAFAPGLDGFLESSEAWYAKHGFDLLASDRNLLGLMLAYLTLVSSNHDAPINHNPTLVSQEARVTWAMLSLCAHSEGASGAGDEADKLARRFRSIESILTGEPLINTAASMSEFIHAEPDPQQPEAEAEAKAARDEQERVEATRTPFDRQVARRDSDFWSTLENIATTQGRGAGPWGTGRSNEDEIRDSITEIRGLLHDKENRDTLYAALLLGWGINNGDPSSERELSKHLLHHQAGGRATNIVNSNLAGMCLRAMDVEEQSISVPLTDMQGMGMNVDMGVGGYEIP